MQNIYIYLLSVKEKETRELRGANIENGPLVPGPDEQTERAPTMMRVGPELRAERAQAAGPDCRSSSEQTFPVRA